MSSLFERVRPTSWGEVVGQDNALKTIARLRNSGGLGGRAFFLSGPSGSGKTTIARLIAAELASDLGTEEMDSSEVTAEWIRDVRINQWQRVIGTPSGRAFIVNEVHGLRDQIVTRMLTLLEPVPAHAVWVFTTTATAKSDLFGEKSDSHPFLSRCVEIELLTTGTTEYAKRLKAIAEAENLDGRPVSDYERLLRSCKGNMRQALNKIESGLMLQKWANI